MPGAFPTFSTTLSTGGVDRPRPACLMSGEMGLRVAGHSHNRGRGTIAQRGTAGAAPAVPTRRSVAGQPACWPWPAAPLPAISTRGAEPPPTPTTAGFAWLFGLPPVTAPVFELVPQLRVSLGYSGVPVSRIRAGVSTVAGPGFGFVIRCTAVTASVPGYGSPAPHRLYFHDPGVFSRLPAAPAGDLPGLSHPNP